MVTNNLNIFCFVLQCLRFEGAYSKAIKFSWNMYGHDRLPSSPNKINSLGIKHARRIPYSKASFWADLRKKHSECILYFLVFRNFCSKCKKAVINWRVSQLSNHCLHCNAHSNKTFWIACVCIYLRNHLNNQGHLNKKP